MGPAGLFAAQLVPPSDHGERPGEVASSPEDSAQIEVGHGVVGLTPDRFAVGGDDLVELPLSLQGEDEGGVSLGKLGLDLDRLAVGGDGLWLYDRARPPL